MIEILKWVGVPGTPTHLALCLGAGVFLLYVWPRSRRLGRLWLALVVVVYLALALPVTATAIANRLPAVPPPLPDALGRLDALIVFDGDNRRGRVAKTRQLYAASPPAEVWILGEAWMLEELGAGGIPGTRLKRDETAANTREQVAWVQRLEESAPGRRFAIVASRLQVPRIVALARAGRITASVVAAPIDDEPPTSGIGVYVPRYIALRVSRDAIYELVALSYYRRQGWIQ